MSHQNNFALQVHVDADDWAYVQRRARYLEAVLVQLLQDRDRLQEWFSISMLASLKLPGLPSSKSGLARIASVGNWTRRLASGKGGKRYEYHFTSLPARAFDALVSRIVDIPEIDIGDATTPTIEVPEDLETVPVNTAPPWVLPFMRLLRGSANGDLRTAWHELPHHMPAGVDVPSADEAAEVIVRFGLSGGRRT